MTASATPLLRRRVSLAALGLWLAAWVWLAMVPGRLFPSADSLGALLSFASRAVTPALDYEAAFVPEGAGGFLAGVAHATATTLAFAVAAMSVAVPAGLALGLLAARIRSHLGLTPRAAHGPRMVLRAAMAATRSVHELIWAVIFLAAFGLSDRAAVAAIALPFAATLGRVYADVLEETDRAPHDALVAAGSPRAIALTLATLPAAGADLAAYTFYRFECAVRASAVVGFFGPETLGRYIRLSWAENHHGEVWTYLYALFALIAALEWIGRRLRARMVVGWAAG